MNVGVMRQMWRTRARFVLLAVLGLGATWLLAACHGPPHIPLLTVTTTADGNDANPGDGVCEVTPGTGDCSLRAAISEANASPVDKIYVPPATYILTVGGVDDINAWGDLDVDPEVPLIISRDGAGAAIDADGAETVLDLHSRKITLEHLGVGGSAGDGISVEGTSELALTRSSVHHNDGAGISIGPSRKANINNTTISTNGDSGIDTNGTLRVSYTTITANTGGGITGSGTSATDTQVSVIAAQSSGPDCASNVQTSTSSYNLSSDLTCWAAINNNVTGTPPQLGPLDTEPLAAHNPLPGSPVLDARPPSGGSCPGSPKDQTGRSRPVGVACDRGAIEADFAPESFVVNTSVDAQDASSTDGICATAAAQCSLRAAITETNRRPTSGAHTISLAADPTLTMAGTGNETNTTGDLDIATNLILDGNGHTINAGSIDRVIHHLASNLILEDMTVTGGSLTSSSGHGAGIYSVSSKSLSVRRSTIAGNQTTNPSADGGGVATSGSATVEVLSTAIWGNTAGDNGGGLHAAGTSLTVTNSTVSGNTAGDDGGAIYRGIGSVEVLRSTLAANGTDSAAIFGSAGITAAGTIISTNRGTACSHPIASDGYNRVVDSSCALGGTGDVQAINPLLTALADNGGPTITHLPYANSPVVDAIPSGTPELCDASTPTDQRGEPRPSGPMCDIGAVEGHNGQSRASLALTVNSPLDAHDTNAGDGTCATSASTCTLRAAVDETNAWPATDTITLATDPTLSLAGVGDDVNTTGDLDTTGHLTIIGDGHTINAAQLDRVIQHHVAVLTLEDLTITGGRLTGPNSQGGGIRATADLDLVDMTATDNHLEGPSSIGGGIHLSSAYVDVASTTISDNTASAEGGGVYASNSSMAVTKSSVRDNSVDANGGGGLSLNGGSYEVHQTTIDSNEASYAGGVLADAALEINSSTISNNVSASDGGGLGGSSAAVAILNSTFSGNHAPGAGAAISRVGGTTLLRYTTIVHNFGPTALDGSGLNAQASIIASTAGDACDGPITSTGWNVSSDATCGLTQASDQQDVLPLLTTLGDHGGPTATRVPFSNSPAVDAIPAGTVGLCDNTVAADQRGVARPDGASCDAGAVEGDNGIVATPLDLVVDVSDDGSDALPGDGLCEASTGGCTIRAAIDEANAWPTADTVTLAPGVDPILTQVGANEDDNATGDLDTIDHLAIEGDGETIDADQLDRVIDHIAGDLRIEGLTLTNGAPAAPDSQGGGIKTLNDLTLVNTTVTGSSAVDGAGIYASGGTLSVSESDISSNTTGPGVEGLMATITVDQSTVSGNTTSGVSTDGGTLLVTNSTIEGNGGVSSFGGGVVLLGNAIGEIRQSLVVGNTGYTGAALYLEGNSLRVENSTISHNVASAGGTVYGPVAIISSTIANNQGAFTLDGASGILVSGSIISAASNLACSDVITSTGWNVVTDATCGLSQPSDQENVDPELSALADNGGSTLSYLPFEGSPVVDAVPVSTPALCDGTIPTDQRGEARPNGPSCDIGAVEGDTGLPTSPLDLVVDSGADVHDAEAGDGVCDTGAGSCTLRAAIDETNAHPTSDAITIAAGVDTELSINGANEDLNASGDLDISDDLTITGTGAGNAIDANDLDRVIDHHGGSLSIADVTITGGLVGSAGGGISSNSSGSLTITGSTIADNESPNSNVGRGGGLLASSSATTIVASTFTGNEGFLDGGGVYAQGGTLEINSSTFTGNQSGNGGGVYSAADTFEMAASSFSDNTATIDGAGLKVEGGMATIEGTQFEGNTGAFGGGVSSTGTDLTVIESTFHDNTASGGGAIEATDGSLTLVASTLSENTAEVAAAMDTTGPVTVTNSTITGNVTTATNFPTSRHDGASAEYRHSTLIGNFGTWTLEGDPATTATGSVLASNGNTCSGPITSQGWNVGSDTTCGLTQTGDQQAVQPALAALADNGGPTETRMPYANSPAVDAIPNGTPSLCDGTNPTDQRGVPRPAGSACDVGAVEGNNGLILAPGPVSLTVNSASDATDATPGDGVCATTGGVCTLRAAISETNTVAGGIDTIAFAAGINPTLSLAGTGDDANLSGDLDIVDDLTINGGNRTLNGALLDRVIHHQTGLLTINDLTVTGGRITSASGLGAGIRTEAPLVFTGGMVSGNQITGASGHGGGIHADSGSTLTVTRSTISGNSTVGFNGQGGGIYTSGTTLTITNSTLSGNSAFAGAALYRQSGTNTLTASTVSSNAGSWAISGPAALTLQGSVIAAGGTNACNTTAITSAGRNIAFDGTCNLIHATDLANTNALLGPLANNGGPTLTHLPAVGSPARNAIAVGVANLCTPGLTDQRGVARPQGAACDRGSVEQ